MLSVTVATPEGREAALRRLLKQSSPGGRSDAIAELLEVSRRDATSLDGLLVAEQDGVPVGGGLYVLQPDRSAFVWPPIVLERQNADEIADAILRETCVQLDSKGVWLGQCLVPPDRGEDGERLLRNGFTHLADMVYLERLLARPVERPQVDLETVGFDPEANTDRFARAVERTYVGTLDCPALSGTRTGAEALDGHRHSGAFDPSRWKIYRAGGRDAGVLLLNDHPDQDAWEVVYMGVVPQARGRGLGRAMLLSGLAEARAAGRGSVLLAVDGRNKYARRIYSDLGFAELGVRAVYVRVSRSAAPQ